MDFLALLCGILAFAAPAATQQKLPRWSLTAELRIGAIDGPDALDAIGDIVVSPATGQIFVTERSQRILVFDDRGRRVGAWGGQGDGNPLWGIETDELGVYYLVKYRVVR